MRGNSKFTRQRKWLLLEILLGCVLLALLTLAVTTAARTTLSSGETSAISTSALSENTDAPPASTTEPATSGQPTEPATRPPVDIPASAGEKKLVALTFDDGPHGVYTPQLLDYLQEQNVLATFFVLGLCAKAQPDTLRRAAQEGHSIGNHTYNHKDLNKLSPEKRRDEIDSSADLIESLIGTRPATLRPPYGVHSEALKAAAGAPLIYWSVDTLDWSKRNADIVYQTVMDNVQDGDIILMHDIYAETVEAAKKIIPALKEQGYLFVTVDQLLAIRGEAKAGNSVRNRWVK